MQLDDHIIICREEDFKDCGDICSPRIPAAAVAQPMPAGHFVKAIAPCTPRAGSAQRGPKRGIKAIAAPSAAVVQVPPVQVCSPFKHLDSHAILAKSLCLMNILSWRCHPQCNLFCWRAQWSCENGPKQGKRQSALIFLYELPSKHDHG